MYVLGLDPRFDRAINSFDLILHPGSLQQANGRIPLPSGKCVSVAWSRENDEISYAVTAPEEAIEIVLPSGKKIRIKPNTTRTLRLPSGL